MNVQLDAEAAVRAPEFFRWLTAALKRDGHKIGVVSSRPRSAENLRAAADELAAAGVAYDELALAPQPGFLDMTRLPDDFSASHMAYAGKLLAALDLGSEVIFEDCGVAAELFRKHLPQAKVFRLLPR